MRNIELKIDGEVIVLTSSQTAQLKRAVEKETKVPPIKQYGGLTLSCKSGGKSTSYPLIISSTNSAPIGSQVSALANGKDFSLAELKTFIKELKLYAA